MKLKSTIKQRLLATILLCLPFAVGAVGLGKLTVISNLGQPLNAELELVALHKEELSLLNVRMASPSAFSQANIQYAPYLPKIKFTLETKPNGGAYYKVTSTQPVTEPFLVMLVELNWAAGRLIREYTILLDPPEMRRAQPLESKTISDKPLPEGKTTGVVQLPEAQPVSPLPVLSQSSAPQLPEPSVPTTYVLPPPAPLDVATAPNAEIQTGVAPKPEEIQKETKLEDKQSPEVRPAESASGPTTTAVPEAKTPVAVEGETYTVKRGDILADIAKKMKPENVSLEQMLLALHRANKSAFEGSNINRLKTGQILTIPDKESALSIEHADATRLIRAQATDWNAYRQKVAEKAAQSADKSQATTQAASGTISAKVEDKVAPKEPSKDQLKLSKSESLTETGKASEVKVVSSPNAASKDLANKEAAKMQERVNALQEEATAKEKAVKEANSRVTDLEKTVKNLQEVLAVKNKALEELQQQAEAAKKAQQTPVKSESEGKVAVTPVTVAPKIEPTTVAVNPVPTPTTESKPVPTPVVTPVPTVTEKPVTQAAPAKPAPQQDSGVTLLDELLSDPIFMVVAAVPLLVIIAWIVIRTRRKKNNSGFEDSIITDGDLKANTVFGNTGGGVVSTGDNSFITDFSREGLGSIDTDEVDPIAEAEVYMAYGRDTQAEEILKDALQKDPSRYQIHVKLLEIYAGRKNMTAFETLASELYAATGGQGEHWSKAAELGRTLDSNNPLYGKMGTEVKVKVAEPSDELDFNKTLAKPAANLSATIAPAQKREAPKLDFDLETTKLAKPVSFDVDAMSSPKTNSEKQVEKASSFDMGNSDNKAPVESSLDEGLTFDLGDLGGGGLETPTDQVAIEPQSSSEEEIGLNFEFNPPSHLETSAAAQPQAMQSSPEKNRPEIKSDVDLSSINLNFDAPSAPTDIAGAPMNFEPDTSPEAMWQQVATKLDLARAYQEMGDQEGAREILQEVAHEGDAKQKQDAEQLLAKLH